MSAISKGLRCVGGIKCRPFLKHSNHWKRVLKRNDFQGKRVLPVS